MKYKILNIDKLDGVHCKSKRLGKKKSLAMIVKHQLFFFWSCCTFMDAVKFCFT